MCVYVMYMYECMYVSVCVCMYVCVINFETNSAENLVNSAAHGDSTNEIPRFTAATQVKFRGLIKS